MTAAVQILLGLALLVAVVLKVLDRDRPPPAEFDDIRALQRGADQRAALRRACRHRQPRCTKTNSSTNERTQP